MKLKQCVTFFVSFFILYALGQQTFAQSINNDRTGRVGLKLNVASVRSSNTDESLLHFKEQGQDTKRVKDKLFKPDDATVVALEASYFFNDDFALALNLALPTTYDVMYGGNELLRKLDAKDKFTYEQKQISFIAQYYLAPQSLDFIPYIGGGMNITKYSDADGLCADLAAGLVCQSSYNKSSSGLVWQAGFNYKFNPDFYFNVDIKHSRNQFSFDQKITDQVKDRNTTIQGKIKQKPVIVAFGIGMQF